MFVTFEYMDHLLFLDYYCSKDDEKHSEYYLLYDKEKIIKQIRERLLDLGRDIVADLEIKMKVFSKNTICNKCSMENEYLIKLKTAINSDQDMPDITEIEVQFLKAYKEKHSNPVEVRKETMKFNEKHGIYSKPLVWVEFYAIYVQWCHSRTECVKLTSCPMDEKSHTHEVDDSMYRHIMTTVPGNFSEEEIKEEMLRLAKEEPQDKMNARVKKEIQRRKAVYREDLDEEESTSDEEESTSQFSADNKDQSSITSAFSDVFSEVATDLFT